MSALEVLILVAIWAVILLPGIVTAAKGHIALFAAGWVFSGLVWPISAWRLAKPAWAGLAAAIAFGLLFASFIAGLIVGLASR